MRPRAWILLLCVFSLAAGAQQPLTLEQAVQLAIERNPALKAAEQDTAIAEAHVGEAASARLPRLDFSQGFTRGNNPVYVFGTLLTQRQFTSADFALNALNTPRPLDNFQTRLDGQFTLFDFGRTRWRISGAKKAKTTAEFQIEQARQDLILRVIQEYAGVLVARQNLDAAREALRTAESGEQEADAREKAGLVVTSDLLSAQVFRAQMKDRELRASNALDLALLTLGRELGQGPQALGQPSEGLAEPVAPAMTPEQWESVALQERPALRAAELEAQSMTDAKQLARAEFAPRLGVFADIEHDTETFGGPSGSNWTAGAKLEWSLFAGGARRYELSEVQARQRQTEDNLEWLRSGVRLEVRQAWLDTQSAALRASAARDAMEQARASLQIIEERYQAGLVTITELLRAQAAQLDARSGYLASLGDWQSARARLERAAGRLTADSTLFHPGGQR